MGKTKERIFAIVDGANFKDGPTSEEATDQIITAFQKVVEGAENPSIYERDREAAEAMRQRILKEIKQ